MTDLCWICQKSHMAIMRSANTPEAEKSQVKKWQLVNIQSYRCSLQVLKDAEAHLLLATQERSHYSHTKFSPDWCFGLFKQAYSRRKIGCLDDIAQAVQESAVVNHAQLVGRQDGTVLVPTYNWAEFFDSPFRQKALKGIASPDLHRCQARGCACQGHCHQS